MNPNEAKTSTKIGILKANPMHAPEHPSPLIVLVEAQDFIASATSPTAAVEALALFGPTIAMHLFTVTSYCSESVNKLSEVIFLKAQQFP